MKKQRIPRIKNSMRYLRQSGLKVKYVLDIGVAEGTPWLQQSFPGAMHRLIEPNSDYNSQIHSNYEDYSHELTNVALGAEPNPEATVTLVKPGDTSHAQTYKIDTPITTLDSLYIIPDQHSVLKIDVDGYELDVLAGGQDTLPRFDILIIEAKLHKMAETISTVPDCFTLWDIVNLDYDWGELAQVDLIFKNRFLDIDTQRKDYPEYQAFRQGVEMI